MNLKAEAACQLRGLPDAFDFFLPSRGSAIRVSAGMNFNGMGPQGGGETDLSGDGVNKKTDGDFLSLEERHQGFNPSLNGKKIEAPFGGQFLSFLRNKANFFRAAGGGEGNVAGGRRNLGVEGDPENFLNRERALPPDIVSI